jgi:hypothetical protein
MAGDLAEAGSPEATSEGLNRRVMRVTRSG